MTWISCENDGFEKVHCPAEYIFKLISISLDIKDTFAFIFHRQEYSMDIFFRQWWYDPRFKHNSSIPFNMAADPTKLFWTPDTYFFNVKSIKYHFVTRENMRVMIYSSGKIYFSARYMLQLVGLIMNGSEVLNV